MGIETQLQEELKQAMRAKDKRTLDVIRMLKSKGLEKKTSAGYHGGDLTETDWLDTIDAYVKSLRKSLPEFEKGGEAAKDTIEQIQFEIAFCSRWLPQMMDEAQTRAAVEALISAMGIQDPKATGQVMGRLMKEHKGKIDANIARRLVEERLKQFGA